MSSLFHNKFVKFGLIGVGILFLLFIVLSVIFTSLNSARSGLSMDSMGVQAPMGMSASNKAFFETEEVSVARDSSYHPSEPTPDDYTSGLESYETTDYSVSGRTKDFDNFCSDLTQLKTDGEIHFKTLRESTNHCSATFYAPEQRVEGVLASLSAYRGVEYARDTSSVTRHRQNLQSRTNILQQQLASVSRSLTMAETQFDELAEFARQSKDAAALSEAIRYKLQNVDTLTQRKINLTSQLNSIYQQATDLEERIGIVEFRVSISRSNPIAIDKYERAWDQAWKDLRDTANDTLIGITAFFGIFLLWTLRISLYLLVVLVIIRVTWKFAKLLWHKKSNDDNNLE